MIKVRSNPFYTSAIFAWSLTEIIRYSFYATTLLGYESYPLLYLRYTTFYVLYPMGALSEDALIFASLPKASPIPSVSSWARGMWTPYDYIRGFLAAVWPIGTYWLLFGTRTGTNVLI
jgi:very-long-chain (3R)-3-hydroxyacyl-CoA dehydratase